MIDSKTMMQVMRYLNRDGVGDVLAWINGHSEEEILKYLDKCSNPATDELIVITTHGTTDACSRDIQNWCKEHYRKAPDFTNPIQIAADMTDCRYILYRCRSFNHPVAIPYGVKNCSHMFADCESFNSKVDFCSTIINCKAMFRCAD